MAELIDHPPGTPTWVELSTPDTDAAISFYGSLFGWSAAPAADPDAGGHIDFMMKGRPVAGAGPLADPAQPAAWSTYISVTDVDDTARRALEAGGKLAAGPADVLTAGRLAVLADPVGAIVGLWQPRDRSGAGLVGEPGAMCWHELTVRDAEAAKSFYRAVFGWETVTHAMGEIEYTEWMRSGTAVGGLMRMDDSWPADLPSHWMVYFAVTDCDRAAARTQALGGVVSVPPTDVPPGRFAVLNDPTGAFFSVIAMREDAT